MVTVGMNYQVKEGKNDVFEQVFNKVIQIMQGLDGHVHTDLFTNVRDPNNYLIMSEWSDRGAFDAFIASEQFRNVANWGKKEVLTTRPRHQYYGDEQTAPSAPAPKPEAASGKCPMGH